MNDPFKKENAVKTETGDFEKTAEIFLLDYQEKKLKQCHIRHAEAQAADTETLTELRRSYAGGVMAFLWFWFGAMCLLMMTYLSYQMTLEKDIPKEIIISAFTSTAVVVGLVGYILKGLFSVKGN